MDLATLLEYLGSAASAHRRPTTPLNWLQGIHFFWFCGHQACAWYTDTYRQNSHRHKVGKVPNNEVPGQVLGYTAGI